MAKKLSIEIIGENKSAIRALDGTAKAAGSFGNALSKTAKIASIALGAAALGGIALTLKQGTEEWMQHAKVAAQTSAALKSTGNAANVTKGHIEALAASQMLKTGVDDELIQSGENLLLTFKNVQNELGKGNAIFDRATVAALDLSQAGFGSIESASKMLGKALNDPVKGMTALGRAGVTFTAEQKKSIKSLAEHGKALQAQKLILKEVESQVGGSAAAFGKTLPGQIAILRQSMSNLAGQLVSGLMPAFRKGIDAVSGFVGEFSAAKGWRAKLNVVWEGIQEAGKSLTVKIGEAVSKIDWGAAWDRAQGMGDGLSTRLASIDWTSVGKTIGDGIATGVGAASTVGKKLADSLNTAIHSVDWNSLGRAAGPGLATAMVVALTTLMDLGFWAKNWDLALAVALAAFGKGLGKIVAPVGRLFAKLGTDAVLALTGGIESFAPKIGAALLAALTKLPGIVGKALAPLTAVVGAVFGRLAGLAKFTVKVLGIQAVLNAVAKLITTLVGKFADAGTWLLDAGTAIIQGLWDGMKSKFESVKKWLSGVGETIKGLKGPLNKDRVLLFNEGMAIMHGLGDGMAAGWARTAVFLGTLAAETLKQINKLQGQLDAINTRREAEDRAAAVRSAQVALTEAQKKKEGVAAAELALARAREDIVVAGLTRQLAKEQALYDRRNAMAQAKMDKLNAIVQRAQDKAAAAFDRMQAKILRAFEATRGAIQTPAEKALAALNDNARQRDLQKALADANASGDQDAILRAQEDILRDSLERQKDIERTAIDQQTESMREKLTDKFDVLSETWKGGIGNIKTLLEGYGIDFANIGALLGDAFRESLIAAIKGASKATTAAKVAGNAAKAATVRIPALDSGGLVTQTGLAMVHRGETFSGVGRGLSGGGGVNVTVNVNGFVGNDQEIALRVRDALVRYSRGNGSIFGGAA